MARCRRRTGLPLLVTLVLSHLCLAPRPTAAQLVEEGRNDEPPVAAIIPFGAKLPKDAEALAALCERALHRIRGLTILPPARWRKEAEESGQGDDLEAMAKRLGADVLITGTLSGSGDARKLSLDVFSEQGLPLGAFEIPFFGDPPGAAAEFLLEDGLARLIRPAVGLPLPPSYPVIAPQPEPTPQQEDKERPIEELLRRQREAAPKPPPPRPPWRAVFEAELLGLAVGRTLGCNPAAESRRNLQCKEASYPFDLSGGGRLALTFFPLSLKRSLPAALSGLGLRATLDLPYWQERLTTAGTTLPVQQLRAEGGLWWRMAFGSGKNKPAVELGVLYGYHKFSLSGGDRPPPFPDAVYQSVIPTAGVGAFLGDRAYLRVQGAYHAVLSAGPLLEAANQSPFGPGSALGFRGTAALDVRVYRQLLLSLGLQAEQLRLSFDGLGCNKTDPNQKECAPAISMIAPITDAADLHLSGWLGLGLRL